MTEFNRSGTPVDIASLRKRIGQTDQGHLLDNWDQLTVAEQQSLAKQLDQIDFALINRLYRGETSTVDFSELSSRCTSPPAINADGTGANWSTTEAFRKGEAALAGGQVGALIVAGGQGTRLGFEKPKGMFPIGPLSGRTLFEIFADRLLAIGSKYGVAIPLYLMTSPATHDETVAYWEQHNYLGLNQGDVRIFCQGTMPAVDRRSGRILLADRGCVALSPDGHGGTLAALVRSGSLDDAESRGIRYLSYGQVDNPLVHLCEPMLVGHHLAAESEMTTQVVRKRYPTERVGNVVLVEDRLQIIEYSDLPEAAALQTDFSGELKLWAGSIAVHVFDLSFLQKMNQQADALPFHQAEKKVPYLSEDLTVVHPEEPNAIKFERFIFDLLPLAKNAFVVEGLPEDVFAPVKNAPGAPADTAALAQQAMVDRDIHWLEKLGVQVSKGVRVEINPRYAIDSEQLRTKLSSSQAVTADTYYAPENE